MVHLYYTLCRYLLTYIQQTSNFHFLSDITLFEDTLDVLLCWLLYYNNELRTFGLKELHLTDLLYIYINILCTFAC